MFMKRLAGGVAASALLLAMAPAAFAQETTSAIRGEVVDGTRGAPVSGATVTIVHQPSGTRETTTTDAQGTYNARGLRVGGPYLITVEGAGIETETLSDINLRVGETTRLDFDVADAAATIEEVVVTARRDPTAANTNAAEVLDRDDIDAVVSVSRDIRDLARRNLLTSQDAVGAGQGISIAGSNPRTNRVTVDGAQAQDDFGLNTGGLQTLRGPISIDAIEQFTVTAVPVDVENGDFQGGALDIVLRKGGNDFHGSAFVNYYNDGFQGDSIRGVDVNTILSQENYGGFISGPIIRDRLFFAGSYESYKSATQTDTGFAGQGFPNEFIGITPAQVDSVTSAFDTLYASPYDYGSLVRSTPIIDEKYTVGLDWNITDNQRASFTARYALSELTTRTDLGRQTAALSDHYYLTGEEDYSYAFELNSDWTDDFTTQLRITHRDYERRQDPLGDDDFADITVCLAPTSVNSGGDNAVNCGQTSTVRFGPDVFRQANFLEVANTQVQFKAEYSLGEHLFKVGYQGQRTDIFNLFVPTSDGQYYFDSLADFRDGRANRLVYSNAVTGNPNDAAADFKYDVHTFLAQDTLQATDNLSITGGFRIDVYKSDDVPPLNPNFVARQGFTNQETYDGLSVFMPRVSFDYDPLDYLNVRGGFGLFSGGVPDVFLSNSFSNTGILTNGVDIQRVTTVGPTFGTFVDVTNTQGFSQAIGATALNINRADARFGFDIPTAVQGLQGGAVVPPTSETNAISPGFQFPSDYKFFLTAALDAPDGWSDGFAPEFLRPALEGWRVTFDGVVTEAKNSYVFRDFRASPLTVASGAAQLTPDGRLRYDGLGGTAAQRAAAGVTSVNPGANRDIVAINTDKSNAYIFGGGIEREFDNGVNLFFGYARQNLEDTNSGARFASTASSLYNTGPTGLDPNEEAYGTGVEEIKNRYKFQAGYRRKFLFDLETRLSLFGEVRDGRPVSYVMDDGVAGRSPTFGVNRDNHLLYVPDFRADTNPNDLNVGFVTFADQNTLNNFRNAVDLFGLEQGAIQDKASGTDNPELYLFDLQLSQELPGLRRDHRTNLVFDLQNLLNLLNDEWGIAEQYFDQTRLVSAQCADANGVVAAAGSPVCARYRYSNFNPTATVKDRNLDRSLWRLQVTLRYTF